MASSFSGQNQGSATSSTKFPEHTETAEASQCDKPPSSEEVSTKPAGTELPAEEGGLSDDVRVRLESCLGLCLCPCPCPSGLVCARESGSGLDPHPAAANSGQAPRRPSGSGSPLLDDQGSGSHDFEPAAARQSGLRLLLGGRDAWSCHWDSVARQGWVTSPSDSARHSGADWQSARLCHDLLRRLLQRHLPLPPSCPRPPRRSEAARRGLPGSSTGTG